MLRSYVVLYVDEVYSYEEEEENEQDSMKNLEKKIYLPCVC